MEVVQIRDAHADRVIPEDVTVNGIDGAAVFERAVGGTIVGLIAKELHRVTRLRRAARRGQIITLGPSRRSAPRRR